MTLDVAALVNNATPAPVNAPAERPESWARVDLAPFLAGPITECVPTLLRRSDGVGLFYEGRVNGIHGDSGIGKTWVAVAAVAQELLAGRRAAWIHYEDPSPALVVSRLLAFGVPDVTLLSELDYRQPEEPPDEIVLAELGAALVGASLVVIDSLGEAFGISGLDENKDTDVGPWMRDVARRLEATGAAVLIIDHSTKAGTHDLHPSGSKRKRAAITGASYLVEAPSALTKEHGGRLRLKCAKDRHGTHKRGAVAADVELTIYPDGGMTWHVWPPSSTAEDSPDARLLSAARAAVTAAEKLGQPASQNRLCELMNVQYSAAAKRAGIEHAIADGALHAEPGPGKKILHTFVRPLSEPAE